MVKTIISFIIIVCITVTMTTKDLSALSPISFKDQILVQANVDFEKDDEKILSVRD